MAWSASVTYFLTAHVVLLKGSRVKQEPVLNPYARTWELVWSLEASSSADSTTPACKLKKKRLRKTAQDFD